MFIKSNYIVLVLLLFFSCDEKNKNLITPLNNSNNINEAEYVIDSSYSLGDVRRYGIFPNIEIGNHQKYKKNKINVILDLAESGQEITFPTGHYNTNLILKGREDVNIHFNNVSFSGQIQIIEDELGKESRNINLLGTLKTYNKFFSRKSQNISIDTLIIASDTLKNNYNKRSLGCNIYGGTKHLNIKKLIVEDLGSGDEYYKFSVAALQIHGWDNNPEYINISEAIIEKSDRHGVYITGNNNSIDKLLIKKVGLGTINYNNGLEDAETEELKFISALWMNKLNNSKISNVTIDCRNSKANYTVNFDEGSSGEPTVIDYLQIINNDSNIKMLPNDLTNIVVRHFKTQNE